MTCCRRLMATLFMVFAVSVFLCSSVGAFTLQAVADQDGIAVDYDFGLRRSGRIELTQETPPDQEVLNIFNTVIIRAGINDVSLDPAVGPPVIEMHLSVWVTGQSMPVFEADIPVPFAEIGIETDRLNRVPATVDEGNDLDAAVLVGLSRLVYDIKVDLGLLLDDRWQGAATMRNPRISEEIIINTGALNQAPLPLPGDNATGLFPETVQVDLTLIPLFTLTPHTTVGLAFTVFVDDAPVLSFPGDIPTLGDMVSVFPLPLPRGNYHLWLAHEIESPEDLIAWIIDLISRFSGG